MFKKFLAFMVAIATSILSSSVATNTMTAPADDSDFIPEVRFVVVSDTHVSDLKSKNIQKIQRVMTLAYSDAEQDENHNTLDAAIFAGDLTDRGYVSHFVNFNAAVNTVIKDETKLLPIVAKNHDGGGLGKISLLISKSITGLSTDFHEVINGFHFIGISASKTVGDHYSEHQREWLREQLDAAVADDPEKPIFVIQHEHISNTVYGSEGWGKEFFRDILCEYPTVVDFSGHSHYPLNDPRSVWQGEFTAIGTGALHYAEFRVDGKEYYPDQDKTIEQCWIVEVDKDNNVRLRGYDSSTATLLCEYTLSNLSDVTKRQCLPEQQEAAAVAPSFDENAALTVESNGEKYTVTIPQAQGVINYPVLLYRVYVLDENGDEVHSELIMNNSWTSATYESVSTEIDAQPGYTVMAAAENAYGMQSQTLTAVVG